MRFWLVTYSTLLLLMCLVQAQEPPVYRDAARPLDERVADLLRRMTLEEKVAQLQGIWVRKNQIQDGDGRFDPSKAGPVLGAGLGQVSRPSEITGTPGGPRGRSPRAQAEYANAVQRWVVENTRLGIPVMFHEEALHGLAAPRGTRADCAGKHLGSRPGGTGDGRRRARGAEPRRPAGAVAGGGARPRSAMGPD